MHGELTLRMEVRGEEPNSAAPAKDMFVQAMCAMDLLHDDAVAAAWTSIASTTLSSHATPGTRSLYESTIAAKLAGIVAGSCYVI